MQSILQSSFRSASSVGRFAQRRTTTILCVRKGDKVVIMGDRQVTLGEKYVAKASTRKLRRAGDDKVLCGFAGSTADAMTLLDKLESKLTEFPGQLLRACVELAKEWRGDKSMRQLNAAIIVANESETLEVDGIGNVITPEEDGVLAIGSGGLFAKAAARALVDIEGMDAEAICKKSMSIASSIDVFSNDKYDMDSIEKKDVAEKDKEPESRVEPKIVDTPTGGGDKGGSDKGGSDKKSNKNDKKAGGDIYDRIVMC